MAREGYTGPIEVIEGKEGLFEVLSNVTWNSDALLKNLGKEYLITRCSYKAFPTEALTHQPISAILKLCREHSINHTDVAEILVETTTRGADILSDPSKYKPETRETADHSLPYVIATAVVEGNVLPESFSETSLRDERKWDLLSKIKVVANPEIDRLFPQIKRARVSIRSTSGKTFTTQTDVAKGSPEDPMTDTEIEAKFHANAKRVLSQRKRDQILKQTWQLERFSNIQEYMPMLIADLQ